MQQKGKFRSQLDLMRGFQRIHPGDLHGTRYFFESCEHEFDELNPESYFPILAAYVNALFGLGEYARLLRYADRLIEIAVVENLTLAYEEEDIFTKTLFQKSFSLMQTGRLEESIEVARQLFVIAPEVRRNEQLYRLALLRRRPFYLRASLGLGVGLGMLYLLLSAASFLLVQPYYPGECWWFDLMAASCLQVGIAAVLGAFVVHQASALYQTAQVGRSARAKSAHRSAEDC